MFEDFQKAIKDVYHYLIGISIEGGKQVKPEKGINMKGYIFLWPFLVALIVVIYLLIRSFVWS